MKFRLNPVPLARMQALHRNTDGSRLLVIEHSDMGRPELFNRIYDDACDVGFATETPRGVVEWCWLRDVNEPSNGHEHPDTIAWVFKAMPEAVKKWPDLERWELHVLND